jgi:predicted acylesterase/phospholipase RssA
MFDRREFLFRMGAAGVLPATLAAAPPVAGPPPLGTAENPHFLEAALVLSGGGARGAFEAGFVCESARIRGVRDGQPLTPYEFVCGTSIGALNGWFVATGQYTKIMNMWHSVSRENILRLKPKYDKLDDKSAGISNRLVSAIRLVGLAKDDRGVAQDDPVLAWMKREVDPTVPLVMPLVWAVTDLNYQRPEYFYRRAANSAAAPPEFIFKSLRLTVGPNVVIREATDDILHKALQASAAIPLVFDPVTIVGHDGQPHQYVDGGVAANSPVSVARTVAKRVDVILLDPPLEDDTLPNAVDVGLASFGTMQRKILETEMSQAYFQSAAKRATSQVLSPEILDKIGAQSPYLKIFLEYLPATDLSFVRPLKTLPVGVGGFDAQDLMNDTFDLGVAAVARGFTPYTYETF